MNIRHIFALGVALSVLSSSAFAQLAELDIPAEQSDRLGADLAYSDGFLAAGAPQAQGTGVVWVARMDEGQIDNARLIVPERSSKVLDFGASIAISSTFLAVQSFFIAKQGIRASAVDVYRRSGRNRWVHDARLENEEFRIGDGFGSALEFHDGELYVGSPGADGRTEHDGAVFVYQNVEDTWRLKKKVIPPVSRYLMWFGGDIEITHDYLVIGAQGHASSPKGMVFVYDRIHGDTRVISSPESERWDQFGRAVTVRDSLLFVSAPQAESNARRAGVIHIYDQDTSGDWKRISTLQARHGAGSAEFGYEMKSTDHMLFVGAHREYSTGPGGGAFYVYEKDTDPPDHTWRQARRVVPPVQESRFEFSRGLAVSESHVFVSAPEAFGAAGRVYAVSIEELVNREKGWFQPLLTEDISSVSDFEEASDGRVWIGTLAGLQLYDGYETVSYRHDPADEFSLSNSAVLALHRDASGQLWIGTENGLNRYDPVTDDFHRVHLGGETGSLDESESAGFDASIRQSVVAIHEDDEGRIWTGTNGRLYRLDADDTVFREYTPFTGPPDSLNERYISGITSDSGGGLWVLAKNLWELDASLYRIDLTEGDIERTPVSEEWGQVGPLFIDRSDQIWIKAPAPVQARDMRSDSLYPPNNVMLPSHLGFQESNDGGIYAATSAGLFRTDVTGGSRLLSVRPNRPSHPANRVRAVALHSDGTMLIGTQSGVYTYESGGHAPRRPVSLVLTGTRIVGPDGMRENKWPSVQPIVLHPDEEQLSFTMAALNFENRRAIRYQYRIEGLDAGWTDIGMSREGTYSHIPPGTYQLRIRAEGFSTPVEDTGYPLIVEASFLESWWFKGVVLLGVISIVLGIHYLRISRIRALERLRMQIASDLHDDLSSSLSAIALTTDIVSRSEVLPEVQRAKLESASETARNMTSRVRDLVWFVDPAHDTLSDLVLRVTDTARTLLGELNLTIRTSVESETHRLGLRERRDIYLISKEVLHNVVRHAGADLVRIDIEEVSGALTVTISDDGRGFDPDRDHGGYGLPSIQRRAARQNAHLSVDSEPGRGTTVQLVFEL